MSISSEADLPRISAHPWGLYQASHLSRMRPSDDRDGFFISMLKDDFRKQRYAYDVSFVPVGANWSRAAELTFALLDDFDRTGYDRDPSSVIFDLVVGLLTESMDADELLLEVHSLPDSNRTKRRYSGRSRTSDGSDKHLPSLGLIPNWSARRTRHGLSQVSPGAGQVPVMIPTQRIRRLHLRESNLARWKRVVKELREVDASKVTSGGINRLSWEGYSVTTAIETQNMAVAAATAPIGWDGRGVFSELVTSPYSAYRRLRFVQFWIAAVEDSVKFLNQFTGSEEVYGPDAFTFSLTGLPVPAEITQAMHDIRIGSLTVDQAHRTYLSPKYWKARSGEDIEK